MKFKCFILLLAMITIVSMTSCRGKAGVKAVEAAQKALKKTPKKSTTIKGGALLESGKYADDAARAASKLYDENKSDEDVEEDSDYDW